jgi:hypothetical protein
MTLHQHRNGNTTNSAATQKPSPNKVFQQKGVAQVTLPLILPFLNFFGTTIKKKNGFLLHRCKQFMTFHTVTSVSANTVLHNIHTDGNEKWP